MFLELPVIADFLVLQGKQQRLIDENLRRQNIRQCAFDYAVGQVLVKAIDPNKLQPQAHGPYNITQVYTNGTISIQQAPHVTEQIKIRRVLPFRT